MSIAAISPQPRLDARTDLTLNERLVALLFREHVTRAELAEQLRLTPAAITRRIQGEIDWRLSELNAVAERLSTTVGYLLGETDDDRRPAHLRVAETTPATDVTEAAVFGLDSVPPEGFEPPTYGSEIPWIPDTADELLLWCTFSTPIAELGH